MEGSAEIAQWIQSGGVVCFAILVYLELRAMRPLLRSLDLAVQALLERERARGRGGKRADETPLPEER